MNTRVSYNLFENLGTSPGSHPDSVQYTHVDADNSVIAFNTVYQPNPSGMQGIQLEAQLGSRLSKTRITNNVIVAKGPATTMSYAIAVLQDPGNAVDGAVVQHNYIDCSGAYGPFYQPSGRNLAFVDNVNMVTGATISAPAGSASSNFVGITAEGLTDGRPAPGSTITLKLRLNEAVGVVGSPMLGLNGGALAHFSGGGGSDTLAFAYDVKATDGAVPTLGIVRMVLPPGTTLLDAFGNRPNLTGLSGAVPRDEAHAASPQSKH